MQKEENNFYSSQNQELPDAYQELTLIWRELCVLHTHLFELTNQEYQYLLTSETDLLESNLIEKRNVVKMINDFDQRRQDCVERVFALINPDTDLSPTFSIINRILMQNLKLEASHQLEKYNDYLVDIIEKIQMQNRKNRQFLNRAMIMIDDLKKDFQSSKKILSYNKKGNLQKHTR